MALLNKPYLYESEGQIPLVIGETKTLRSGLFYARKQAENYAEKYKVKDILVTDGVRYLYRKRVKSSNEKYYYMNLLKLRKRHPYYGKIEGANELLKLLLKK